MKPTLPVLFNCGASRSGQSVSMSKEVLDSSLDEPELEAVVAKLHGTCYYRACVLHV